MVRFHLFCGGAMVSMVAGLATSPVLAQTTEESPPSASTASPSGADAGQVGQTELGEIIVTAQKRSEKLKDVPATLLVRDSDQLVSAGVRQPTDLTVAFPGLTYTGQKAVAQPAIRGVTTAAAGQGDVENPVAVYIDGIYQPGQAMTQGYDLTNVANVEVLKGPQGTVFGRNVVAGAILVATKDPQLNTFIGDTHFTLSNYGGGTARSALNNQESFFVSIPVVDDRLAISLAGAHTGHEGWDKDLTPGSNGRYGAGQKYSLQGKILWEPTNYIKLLFNARYFNQHEEDAPTVRDGVSASLFFPDGVVGTLPWQVAHDSRSEYRIVTQSYSLRADIDTDVGTLTSLSAYQKEKSPQAADTDGGFSPLCQAAFHCIDLSFNYALPTILSQEIDFSSRKFGRFSFVAGAFAYRKDSDLAVWIFPTFFGYDIKSRSTSYAGFGEVTFDITDRLTAIAGIRYTDDSQTGQGKNSLALPFSPPESHNWTALTKRFSVKYRASDSLNLYVTRDEGYQSGLITTSAYTDPAGNRLPETPPVQPQYLKAWEIGAKYNLPGLTLNLEGFHYDWTNILVQTFNGTIVNLSNAAAAKIYGLDADGSIRLAEGLTLSGGVSWLPRANYTSFPNALVYLASGHTALATLKDLTGARLIRSPKVTLSVALDYETDLASGKLHLNANLYHSSTYSNTLGNQNDQTGYSTLGARASYSPNHGPLTYTVFGRNLTNKAYGTGIVVSSFAYEDFWAPPREVGITIDYKF